MSTSTSKHALSGAPVAGAAMVVMALAAAPLHQHALGAATVERANAIYDDLLVAARAGGFTESLLLLLAVSRRLNGLSEQLAAEVVACIGGPDKFFALLDLSTTPDDWNGFTR